jgi:hypothetical protein
MAIAALEPVADHPGDREHGGNPGKSPALMSASACEECASVKNGVRFARLICQRCCVETSTSKRKVS